MSEEERASRRVIKLKAVVALDCLDGAVKLRACIGKEVCEGGDEIEKSMHNECNHQE
jgi:hypothetical protein